jgi:hypothetical protein
MVLVHDDDLNLIDGLGDDTVSGGLYYTVQPPYQCLCACSH